MKEVQPYDTLPEEEKALTNEKTQEGLVKLRNMIARWYQTFRMIAIVGLLSILVYIGIRMIICSTANEKAKYKQLIWNWFIALCLLFVLHYIMAGTMWLVDKINDVFVSASTKKIELMRGDDYPNKDDDRDIFEITVDGKTKQVNYVTNLMNYARLYSQLANTFVGISFTIIYLALVAFTISFTFTYIGRFAYMAFLTMIAPLVAFSYPLDKAGDGQAQAFNMWLKEYVFNALIQPFHLLIYTVFVTMALDFATSNLIYVIAILLFIKRAEKVLRKMFKMDRASATGGMSGMATGMVAGNLLNKIAQGRPKMPPGQSGNANNGLNRINKPKIGDFGANGTPGANGANGTTGGNTLPSGGPSATSANIGNNDEDPVKRMQREGLEEKLADGQISQEEFDKQSEALGLNANNQAEQEAQEQLAREQAAQEQAAREEDYQKRMSIEEYNSRYGDKSISGATTGNGNYTGKKGLLDGLKYAGKQWAGRHLGKDNLKRTGLNALKLATDIGAVGLGAAAGGLSNAIQGEDIASGISKGGIAGYTGGRFLQNSVVKPGWESGKHAISDVKAGMYGVEAVQDQKKIKENRKDLAKRAYWEDNLKAENPSLAGKELRTAIDDKIEQAYYFEKSGISNIEDQKAAIDMKDRLMKQEQEELNERIETLEKQAKQEKNSNEKTKIREEIDGLRNQQQALGSETTSRVAYAMNESKKYKYTDLTDEKKANTYVENYASQAKEAARIQGKTMSDEEAHNKGRQIVNDIKTIHQ